MTAGDRQQIGTVREISLVDTRHRHRTAGRAGAGRIAAYALGEGLGWTTGLGRLPTDAKAFYGTIAVATLIGMFINFVGIDPIKALLWAGCSMVSWRCR